jgi:hypothetical protein
MPIATLRSAATPDKKWHSQIADAELREHCADACVKNPAMQSGKGTCANDPGHDARAVLAGARPHVLSGAARHLDSGYGLHGHETKHDTIWQPAAVLVLAIDQLQKSNKDLEGLFEVWEVGDHARHLLQCARNHTRLQIQARLRGKQQTGQGSPNALVIMIE